MAFSPGRVREPSVNVRDTTSPRSGRQQQQAAGEYPTSRPLRGLEREQPRSPRARGLALGYMPPPATWAEMSELQSTPGQLLLTLRLTTRAGPLAGELCSFWIASRDASSRATCSASCANASAA